MRHHRVKFNLQLIHVIGLVVRFHDTVRNGTFLSLFLRHCFSGHLLNLCSLCLRNQGLTVNEINTAIM